MLNPSFKGDKEDHINISKRFDTDVIFKPDITLVSNFKRFHASIFRSTLANAYHAECWKVHTPQYELNFVVNSVNINPLKTKRICFI
jgi:hypothetical protein